ncbi:MAG TPA: hypothetical protein VL337_03915 [Acidimicrobiales bacterium]|nr:hypothetical protein [Acidimicrobiales bacterium]
MAVDERSRHELYRRLEDVLGPEAATTLIEHLPPVGWADVATRHDLAGLEQRIDLRLDRVYERFNQVDERFNRVDESIEAARADLRATFEHELRAQSSSFGQELRAQTTTMVFGLVGVVLTMAALAFALVRFT